MTDKEKEELGKQFTTYKMPIQYKGKDDLKSTYPYISTEWETTFSPDIKVDEQWYLLHIKEYEAMIRKANEEYIEQLKKEGKYLEPYQQEITLKHNELFDNPKYVVSVDPYRKEPLESYSMYLIGKDGTTEMLKKKDNFNKELKEVARYYGRNMIRENRATGRTTRLADEAIQTLFTEGKVTVKDHADTKYAQQDLLHKILSRLENEHGGINRFIIDRKTMTITKKTGQRTIQHK